MTLLLLLHGIIVATSTEDVDRSMLVWVMIVASNSFMFSTIFFLYIDVLKSHFTMPGFHPSTSWIFLAILYHGPSYENVTTRRVGMVILSSIQQCRNPMFQMGRQMF